MNLGDTSKQRDPYWYLPKEPKPGEIFEFNSLEEATAFQETLKQYSSGAVRSETEGKIDYSLVLDGPLFERLAIHLTKAAPEKGKRNWMNAHTQEDYDRFRESFVRHVFQFLQGDESEDHAAAIAFNLNGLLYVRERLAE